MSHFSILEEKAEDELHAQRLLRVEERPFERVKLRLLGPATPIQSFLTRTNTDKSSPNDASGDEIISDSEDNSAKLTPDQHAKFLKDLQRFREDVILDFRAFEASIARIQFLLNANQKERERYSADKIKIQDSASTVRDNTARLKIRLDEAQRTLAVRKGYDVLAEKITRDLRLKDREEQGVEIERLKAEIEELEREGTELGGAWIDRRAQFGRVVEEGVKLRRVVRDEKEPEETGKGEDDEDEDRESRNDGDVDDMLGVDGHTRDTASNMGTPRPEEDAPTPLPGVHESGAMTPRSTLGETEVLTPRPDVVDGHDTEMQEDGAAHRQANIPTLKVDDEMDTS